MFGSYPFFSDIPRWVRQVRVLVGILGGRTVARWLLKILYRTPLGRLKQLASRPKLKGIFRYAGDFPGAYLHRCGLYLPEELGNAELGQMLEEDLLRLQPEQLITHALRPEPGTPFGKVATLEVSIYMRNQLLRDTDWTTSAHSLECGRRW